MATLYELSDEYIQLLDMASDPDTDPECLKDTLEALGGEIEDKADGYAKVMQELDGQVASIDAEITRLKARKDALTNSSHRIKNSLESAMRATGKTKFKTTFFSFGIQKNPASVKISDDVDLQEVPPEFLKFKAPEIDKTKVKDALKNGEEFGWAQLVQTEGLRIK